MSQCSSRALWAWGVLFVVAATAPTTLAGGFVQSYTSGCTCSGFPSASNVGSWYCVNDDCTAKCFDGYTGTVTATCGSSGWVVSGQCVKIQTPTCSGIPTADYASFPSSCDGLDYVKGTCNAGYTGSIYAQCEGGKWVIYGKCVEVPKTCTGKPTYAYGYFDDCTNKNWVQGYCSDGYTGSIYAKCESGTWAIYGQCTKIEVPKYCTGKPTYAYGYFDDCTNKNWVKGYCSDGYTGSIYAKCESGTWVIYGQCTKIEVPKYCTGKPTYAYGYFDDCTNTNYVKGHCSAGYTGKLYAQCEGGVWVIYGECIKIEVPKCYGTPVSKHGYFKGNCDGKDYVEGYCYDGYEGEIYAKCEYGTWVIYDGCNKIQPRCDKYCYGTPSIAYGSFPDQCDGLSYVEGCCDEGYKGRIYAKCECGTWVTYGTCAKITYTNICYGKPKTPKHAKSFSWKSCNGKSSCSTKCKGGCGGKGYKAKCVHGKWKVSGSCAPKKYYFTGGHYGGHY